MIEWKERLGNEIKMMVSTSNGIKEVIGTVFEGERYRDGIVSMHGYDGVDYWAGCNSYSIQKTENTLPDLLDNYDYIMKMSKEELAKWLTKTTDDAQSDSDTKCNYQWREWLDEEHK